MILEMFIIFQNIHMYILNLYFFYIKKREIINKLKALFIILNASFCKLQHYVWSLTVMRKQK